jgi:hypothetical protein
MKRLAAVLSLSLALGSAERLVAHEGHVHKLMGVVAGIDATSIEVADAKDGKKTKLALTPATRFVRDKAQAVATDVKVGQRVVVSYVEEDGVKKVEEVALGVVEPPQHDHAKH